ncbi:MAG: hypothetical protein KAR35_04300 [Candidatus Heimdallarchaeota archaeon]|nr:hypothetical protein [Candidatus Heimdallarchaeota archaeon]MCK5048576.1 hypothetical protein [Candidatus Heimdallarchaeota archaeon]
MTALNIDLRKFLARYGEVEENPSMKTLEGKKIDVPFVVKNKSQAFGVWIWDWKRSIGSDKIIRIEKIIISLELDGALLFSNRFSQNAYDLVNKMKKENSAKIILIKLDEIMKPVE